MWYYCDSQLSLAVYSACTSSMYVLCKRVAQEVYFQQLHCCAYGAILYTQDDTMYSLYTNAIGTETCYSLR
jgi:hypothetical protein